MKPSHRPNLAPEALEAVARTHFDAVQRDGGLVRAQFGAITNLAVRGEGRELEVDLAMNPKVDEAVAAETIRRYNRFLEAATGYSSKERARRLRKSAGE